MLRSKYANDETPTFVEFIFEYNNIEYRVKRNPEYMRKAKKGDGLVKETSNAELHLPDNTVITKIKEVTSKIEDIIGLNKEQFSQIAMIAQGDFLKLIHADTNTRQNIFRDIFKTHGYRKLQETLKMKLSEVNLKCDKISNSVNQYISGISCSDDEISNKLRLEKDKEYQDGEVLDLLKQLILKDKNELNILIKELSKIEKDLIEVNSNKEIYLNIQKYKENIKLYQEKLKEILDKLEKLNSKETNMKIIETKILKEREEITILEKDLEKYINLDEIQAKKKSEINTLENYKKIKSINIKNISEIEENIKINVENQEKNLKIVNNDINYESVLKEEEYKLEQLQELEKNIKTLNLTKINLEQMQEKTKQDNQKWLEISKKYNEEYIKYLDNQAGILAQRLEDNSPCAVCGSKVHPNKAKKTKDVISEVELEKLKNEQEDLRKIATLSSENAAKILGEKNKQEDMVNNLKVKLKDVLKDDFDIVNKNINNNIEELNIKIKEKQEANKLLKTIEENIKKLTTNKEKFDEENKQIDIEITKSTSNILNLDENINKIKESLKFESSIEMKEFIENKKGDLNNQEKVIKEYSEEKTKMNNEKIKIETSILESEKNIKDSKEFDIEILEKEYVKLITKKEDVMQKKEELFTRIKINEECFENIDNRLKQSEETQKEQIMIKSLSNTSNGSISGKEKIMLETFIQMTYFDKIIARANTRFSMMTDGQYELKRRTDLTSKVSQGGLELDVLDHYNASIRDIKTLSGGESFKASLSLALGLADEVQSSTGGIRIDTMFIDEGFGSLDEDSLKKAIDTLIKLSVSNKLIGIISHVSELKERIDKQIIVKKDKSGGSRLEIIT